MKKNIYWTDMHSNLHYHQIDELEKWYNHAKEILDFWPIAYYPYYMRKDKSGLGVEDIYPMDDILKQWEVIREFFNKKETVAPNFPIFMGYEWQGSGEDGDHNIFYLKNDETIYNPRRYSELIKYLKPNEAIAIPHHLAYELGHRGKNWKTHSEIFSPFAEIYSSHGSSENGYTDLHMSRHIHMGPRTGGTSYFNGLEKGHLVGAIASGDNHSVPAMYGHGFMAVVSEKADKKSLWEAMLKRNVYGVSGNKIELHYRMNNGIMGDLISSEENHNHEISINAGDAINRVELYKNNILEDTYIHSGKWERNELEESITFKFRVEFGWGPDTRIYPDITTKIWNGKLKTDGEIVSVEKCWTSFGQSLNMIDKNSCEFQLITHKTSQSGKWMGPSPVLTEGFIFEIKALRDSNIILEVDGKVYEIAVESILKDTQLIADLDGAKKLAKERFGFDDYYRTDPFWHNAYKIRINRGTPEIGYRVDINFQTKGIVNERDFYMVKVFQRDGNLAWSSPIWVDTIL